MNTLYQELPNTVKIVLSDKTGEAERFSVGQSLDEAIAAIEAAFGGEPAEAPKKARKKRRTKAEMNATAETADPVPYETQDTPRNKNNKKEKAWAE